MNAPHRILVVDDTPDDRVLVAREAAALFPDAQLVEAGSRAEFESALERGAYELAVTDLQLKWGTGREVLARVRSAFPRCPVIMFTDSGDEMTAVEMMKAGLDDYVLKSARQLPRLRASMKLAVESALNRTALTERERQLTAALAHEETIVRELHHRVKNNLQTITSLLEIRARARDGEIATELLALAGRMRALALVQARIYETHSLDRVDFAGALSDLANQIAQGCDDRIGIDCDFDGPLDLGVTRAMPLALVCYEMMLNAVQHAWPDRRTGKLAVRLRSRGEAPEIDIADDGIGMVGRNGGQGLGTRLLQSLSSEARIAIRSDSVFGRGTTVTIRL